MIKLDCWPADPGESYTTLWTARSLAPTASGGLSEVHNMPQAHTAKIDRKAIGKQLNDLKRDLEAIDGNLLLGKILTDQQMERLTRLRTIYEQQKYMYDNRMHSVPDHIPIVRGEIETTEVQSQVGH